jgi:hypothetical protein
MELHANIWPPLLRSNKPEDALLFDGVYLIDRAGEYAALNSVK